MVEAAKDELRGVGHTLEADDVFGTPHSKETQAYAAYLLHSGLWRSDPHSPIGMQWLRRSGAGAELERRVEEDTRADVARHGPEIRSPPGRSRLGDHAGTCVHAR